MFITKEIFCYLLILLILYAAYIYIYDGTQLITSTLNFKQYRIRRGPHNIQVQKANKLANLEFKLESLVNEISKNESEFSDKDAAYRLIKRWPNVKKRIRETGRWENDAAYVIGKGSQFRICLTQKASGGSLENDNLLVFVAIHEMAHVCSISYGHGDEFQKNFGTLLRIASNLTINNPYTGKTELVYERQNFALHNENFCGVPITSSPF